MCTYSYSYRRNGVNNYQWICSKEGFFVASGLYSLDITSNQPAILVVVSQEAGNFTLHHLPQTCSHDAVAHCRESPFNNLYDASSLPDCCFPLSASFETTDVSLVADIEADKCSHLITVHPYTPLVSSKLCVALSFDRGGNHWLPLNWHLDPSLTEALDSNPIAPTIPRASYELHTNILAPW